VRANADLHRLPDAAAATERILDVVDMVEPAGRQLDTYSKGMRQRIKIAAALVHEPEVLLLDEPFNGVDPRQRMHLMDLLRQLGDAGRTVLFSSHILRRSNASPDISRLSSPAGTPRPATSARSAG
jgi:ABC-2 type transport system ATP-binding protein